jgi:hypothetical protein
MLRCSQGSTIRKLVSLLKVPKDDDEAEKDVFHLLMDQSLKHLRGGVESVVGLHGEYWVRHCHHVHCYHTKEIHSHLP